MLHKSWSLMANIIWDNTVRLIGRNPKPRIKSNRATLKSTNILSFIYIVFKYSFIVKFITAIVILYWTLMGCTDK